MLTILCLPASWQPVTIAPACGTNWSRIKGMAAARNRQRCRGAQNSNIAVVPGTLRGVRANHAFLHRAVEHLHDLHLKQAQDCVTSVM
jgi:hypothetical protein